MPCYYTGSAEGDAALAAQQALESKQVALTWVTSMLCELCQRCDDQKVTLPPNIEKWWRGHQEMDARRKNQTHAKKVRARLLRQPDQP